MIVALAIALALSVIANAAVVGAFLLYLHRRDDADRRDRQVWANRVQAPITAVAQTLEDSTCDDGLKLWESEEDELPVGVIPLSE